MNNSTDKSAGDEEIFIFDTEEDVEDDAVPWRLLVVDDEQGVHDVTVMLLKNFRYRDRPLEILHAYSGGEAREIFEQSQDIALVLVDVVMETESAGLDAVRYIREDLGNKLVRIVVRTGQPGVAGEHEVINGFEIDDYRDKTELSAIRLKTVVQTALASYSASCALLARVHNLDRSNKGLEQFAFAAAHDLRAPLRQITAFAGLLATDLADSLDDQRSQYLKFIISGARNMSSLLEDLLELSTVGNNDTLRGDVDCDEALDEALENLGEVISERGALIERSALPLLLRASYRYWVQLFQNLVANGIKFQGGERPEIHIGAEQKEGQWVISVADRGIGISEKNAEQIFTPFTRLNSTSQYEGTGLGLALCQRVADFHNGKIWAESVVGEGTTIFISVPIDGIR